MRLTVAGRQIEAVWHGDSSPLIPIVLLHHGLGSARQWRDFPEALSEQTGRRVISYSRFGHGHSDPPPKPRTVHFMHEEARLLPAILDAAGIARAHFLGHSDGGSIALIFAAEHPDRVETLILEAPHVFVEDLSISGVEQAAAAYREGNLRERMMRYHRHVDVAFSGWSDVWLDPTFRKWNLESFLSAISCPLLLVQGEQDEYGTLAQIDAIERQVQGAVERLVLSECGHRAHRDQRERVLSAVTTFLSSRA